MNQEPFQDLHVTGRPATSPVETVTFQVETVTFQVERLSALHLLYLATEMGIPVVDEDIQKIAEFIRSLDNKQLSERLKAVLERRTPDAPVHHLPDRGRRPVERGDLPSVPHPAETV